MYKIPEKYNTSDFIDLTTAWKDLVTVADGASEKQIYSLAEDVLRKINKPVTKENMDIIVRMLMSMIKFDVTD